VAGEAGGEVAVAYTDPRGPMRTVIARRDVTTKHDDGQTTWHYVVTLDCGHERKPNPTMTVKVGENYRCFGCAEEQERVSKQ